MTASAAWISRPVFLSSTFRDMHAERDHLREIVFPELDERLRERRHHLEPIDLRWGVETVSLDQEHEKELLVLKVCLAEIERSRPFLIVLLGDRYGWVPPEDRMTAAAREAGFAGEIAGKSVTALEIEFGALSDLDQLNRTWFYYRDPLPLAQMPADLAVQYRETDPQAAERLAALKRRIGREHPDRVRHYQLRWNNEAGRIDDDDLKSFGRQVCDDLWSDLDGETAGYAQQPALTWQDEERSELERFVEDRGRGFLGREETVRQLLSLALSPTADSGLVGASVTGRSGSGKSSLFAHLYRTLEREDVLLLGHAAGISLRSLQVDSLLRRWIGELAAFLQEDDPSVDVTDAEELATSFGSLLGRAALRKRVVVLLDALNQFEPTVRARHLTWWPKLWPPNARVITTATAGTASAALEQRPGIEAIALPLLTQIEAENIVRAVCRRYHREIHLDVVQRLIAKETGGAAAAGIPLWLELAVEELNLLDADDFLRVETEFQGTPEQRLHQLLLDTADRLPPTVAAIYGFMLARTEQVVGRSLAQGFANLVALSRSGWRESDLQALIPIVTGEPWNSLQFTILRRAFRAHLVKRGLGGRYDFFHQQMREAIGHRYLQDAAEVRGLHNQVANHILTLSPQDPLRQSELMYHLIGTGDRQRVARFYALRLSDAELAGATRALATHILDDERHEAEFNLKWVLSLADIDGLEADRQATLCHHYLFDLADALADDAPLCVQIKVAEQSQNTLTRLVAHDPSNSRWQRDLSISHGKVGDLLVRQGDTDGALEAYRKSLNCFERLAAKDPINTDWHHDLAISHEQMGKVLAAQGDTLGAMDAFRESLGLVERGLARDPTHAALLQSFSSCHIDLGDLLLLQGDASGALEHYKTSQPVRERLAAQDPTNPEWQENLAISNERAGQAYLMLEDADAALEAFRKALVISEGLATQNPIDSEIQRNFSNSQSNVGDALLARGDTAGALESYRKSQFVRERLATKDPTNSVWQLDLSISCDRVGRILGTQGDTDGALAAHHKSLEILKQLAKQDPSNTRWLRSLAATQHYVGNVLLTRGDTGDALDAYKNSLVIAEQLAAQNSNNARSQHDLLVNHAHIGEALRLQGDIDGARNAYRNSLEIAERLASQHPNNAVWQRTLAMSYYAMAGLRDSEKDRWFQKCHLALRRMRSNGMNLNPELTSVLNHLDDLVDRYSETLQSRDAKSGSYQGSTPHPLSDANRAAELNIQYQKDLKHWQALPFWERWLTKRPKRPRGI